MSSFYSRSILTRKLQKFRNYWGKHLKKNGTCWYDDYTFQGTVDLCLHRRKQNTYLPQYDHTLQGTVDLCLQSRKKLFVALFYGQSGCFYLFQHWLYCLLNQVFVTFELKTREKFSTSVAVLTILSREPWIFLYSAILPNSAIFTSKIFQ